MEILNNISPLPFYTSLEQQHHRKDYVHEVCPLIMPANYLLPFQFVVGSAIRSYFNNDFNDDFDKGKEDLRRMAQSTFIQAVKLWDYSRGTSVDITAEIKANRLGAINLGDSWLIKYPGTLPISKMAKLGIYYLEIILTGMSVYSDLFATVSDTSGYIVLDYGNAYNIATPVGPIDFSDDFRFKCYIDAEIGKPDYVFEEEATERMGYTFIESQVSKKVYKFAFPAPEYLCDALRIVRLCDSKRIFTKYKVHELFTFSMLPKWEDYGDIAIVECEFETDTIISNIGNLK